ncbi:glycine-rich cell wall structural protein 1.0-like [Nilaparvata lugens]|uniref:glycine-rich cell wall structural protein 1.0-like n=1 Tax=Nilaparvata lugens TaxID=108931 RepID=UPI00193D8F04|nr:glycine-rich cell wall structural protein 1.0-like [Nilaparvata lugens]
MLMLSRRDNCQPQQVDCWWQSATGEATGGATGGGRAGGGDGGGRPVVGRPAAAGDQRRLGDQWWATGGATGGATGSGWATVAAMGGGWWWGDRWWWARWDRRGDRWWPATGGGRAIGGAGRPAAG